MNKLCQAELPVVRRTVIMDQFHIHKFCYFKKSLSKCRKVDKSLKIKVITRKVMVYLWYVLSILELLFIWGNVPCNAPPRYKNIKQQFLVMILWFPEPHFAAWPSFMYAPVANVCDLLLFLDENRIIPDFKHFWKVTSLDEELFTVLYFPFGAFPMTWPRKLFTGLNSTGMMVTWLRTLANTRP